MSLQLELAKVQQEIKKIEEIKDFDQDINIFQTYLRLMNEANYLIYNLNEKLIV